MRKKFLAIFLIVAFSILVTAACSKRKMTQKPAKTTEAPSPANQEATNMKPSIPSTSPKANNESEETAPSAEESVKLEPFQPNATTDIKVDVPEDFNGDIQWYVNNNRIYDVSAPILPHNYFKRGDTVKVTVIYPSGKVASGQATIGDAPPQIILSDSNFELDDVLHYHINVEDPDNDNVKIDIIEAPEGYKYDPTTRTLAIPISNKPGQQVITFTIKATDPYGRYNQKKIAYKLNTSVQKLKVK